MNRDLTFLSEAYLSYLLSGEFPNFVYLIFNFELQCIIQGEIAGIRLANTQLDEGAYILSPNL